MGSTRTLLLVCALVVGATLSTTLAQPSKTAARDAKDSPCGARPAAANATPALRQWALACRTNMTEFRQESLRSFADARVLLDAKLEAARAHAKATFLDGKVAAVEKCLAGASTFDRNASGPRSGEYASCMRAELKPLREADAVSRNATATTFRADAAKARDDSKALFQQLSDAWLAADPRPS